MAENESGTEKSEEPTSKKLGTARSEGHVPKSQEVSTWFMLLGLLVILAFILNGLVAELGGVMVKFIAQPEDFAIDVNSLSAFGGGVLWTLGAILLLPIGMLVAMALISAFIQNGFIFTTEQIKPKLGNLSIKKGFKKVFGLNSIVEFLKGVVKLTIVTIVTLIIVLPDRDKVMDLIWMDIPPIMELLRWTIFKLVLGVVLVMTVITIADVIYKRYEHRKGLRMTKQEVKDEHKQTEGDPKIKTRIRQIRFDRARQRMMAAVPQADVVITNPTHYAVALRYDQDTMEAPRLLAKGMDDLALRIREVARENKIPIVENPPLARALHASVELDQEIPPDHYKAVAEVISYVMRVHGKLRSANKREARRRA